LAEILLILADFVKCNTMGSTSTNNKKLDQDFFDYIPGTEQIISNKEDNMSSKKLGAEKLTSITFITDSAATSHMKLSVDRMDNLFPWKIKVKVGNSNKIEESAMQGTYKGMVIQKNGSRKKMTLSDVFIVPDLWVYLLSLVKGLRSEKVQLRSQGTLISFIIGMKVFMFDREFKWIW
jgi:hypothetical protein